MYISKNVNLKTPYASSGVMCKGLEQGQQASLLLLSLPLTPQGTSDKSLPCPEHQFPHCG